VRGRRDGERDDHRAPLLTGIDSTLVGSALGWTLRGLVAFVAAVLIYVVGAAMIKTFHVDPDDEPDPDDVVPVDLRYRCIVCGAEVTMTSAQAGEEPDAPRHCREDMALVPPV
jgi:hypothetical protein